MLKKALATAALAACVMGATTSLAQASANGAQNSRLGSIFGLPGPQDPTTNPPGPRPPPRPEVGPPGPRPPPK